MTNWEHEIIEPEDDQTESAIEYEKLSVGANWNDLEIIPVEDGRFFVQATDDCNGEIDIGHADSLEAAKLMAERWALAQIAEMLKALGAEGIWMVRGTDSAELVYYPAGENSLHSLRFVPPHPRLMLIRFPTGDGGEGGIEHL